MAPLTTIGESLAHVSCLNMWTMAVIAQVYCPGGITLSVLYVFGPSFFISVPWRLTLLLSWGAYLSVLFLIRFHAVLFLPRTPVVVVQRLMSFGAWGGGLVIGTMESVVFAVQVDDRRVLAGCTGGVAMFIVALVAFWAWLARTYGGGGDTGLPR
ncbi:hypothetical protein C2845_PM10G03230 [Panicum miliaceum]|uniref:DUF7378 domain-containing protein n=1 Tax=Panicum miliaceum TaxID=4540 RepID=A0A3L6PGE2_PANMI|nr:hypothetical protein C2845_PM10G03230 [Panicum miliaceum]